jgi:hypothetical protein
MILLAIRFLKNDNSITLWPFLLVTAFSNKDNADFMSHERIQSRQQELLAELLFIWHVLEFALLRMFISHNAACRNIVFEREAYAMECDLQYLKKRRWYSFLKLYGKKHMP